MPAFTAAIWQSEAAELSSQLTYCLLKNPPKNNQILPYKSNKGIMSLAVLGGFLSK